MSPGNGDGAPRQESAAQLTTTTTPDCTADADNVTNIAVIGAVSREIAYEAVMTALRIGGEGAMRAARGFLLTSERHVQLEARRELDHQPCRLKSCHGRCSRCVHAESWRRRGGRPFEGVEAERKRVAS